jgi:predicted dehydrogenase
MADRSSILIAGFGSIGRRHLRNLRASGQHDIVVYRSGKSTLSDEDLDGLAVEYSLDDALRHQPAAAVISNPTALHLPVALALAQAGCHLLIEKPVSDTLDGIDELRRVVAANNLSVLVGFQFRFHPGLLQVKHLIEDGAIGPVVSVQAHWGEYLPEWHPWEDYRHGYSARPDLGGGVVLTLCHPLDYLRWLIGEIDEVCAAVGHMGGLGIPVEDTADILLHFSSGVTGHVHLDYVQRPSDHWLQINGQEGTLRWDNTDGCARCYRAPAEDWEVYPIAEDFERNRLFLDEIRHFLACVAGSEQPLCTLEDGVRALQIALAIKQAAVEKRVIQLP